MNRPSRTCLTLAATSLAALVVASGCSSSAKAASATTTTVATTTTQATTTTLAALSHDELAIKVNGICRDVKTEMDKVTAPTSFAEAEVAIPKFLAPSTKGQSDIEALVAPAADKATIADLVSDLKTSNASLKAALAAAKSQDQTVLDASMAAYQTGVDSFGTKAAAAGFADCASAVANSGDLGVNSSTSAVAGALVPTDVTATAPAVAGYEYSALQASLVAQLQKQIDAVAILKGHVRNLGTTIAQSANGEKVVVVLMQLDSTLSGVDQNVAVLKAITGSGKDVVQANLGKLVGVSYTDADQFDYVGITGDTVVITLSPSAAVRDDFTKLFVAAAANL